MSNELTTVEDILSCLVKNANRSDVYLLVNVHDYSHFSEFNQMIHNPLKPDVYYHLSKENFISMMFDFSLSSNIINITYNMSDGASGFNNHYTEIEMNVYVEKTSDHTSNITVEMMEMFCKLPIITLNSAVNTMNGVVDTIE